MEDRSWRRWELVIIFLRLLVITTVSNSWEGDSKEENEKIENQEKRKEKADSYLQTPGSLVFCEPW